MGITQTRRRANVLRGQLEAWCEETCAVTPVEDWGEELARLLEHWAWDYGVVFTPESYEALQLWMHQEQELELAAREEDEWIEHEPAAASGERSPMGRFADRVQRHFADRLRERIGESKDDVVDYILKPGPGGFLDDLDRVLPANIVPSPVDLPFLSDVGGVREEAFDFYRKMFAVIRDVKDQPDGGLVRGAVIGYAASLGDVAGVRELSDAFTGEDLYTGEKLSTRQRIGTGILGSITLLGTAFGGRGLVRRIKSATTRAQATATTTVERIRSFRDRVRNFFRRGSQSGRKANEAVEVVVDGGAWALIDDLKRGVILEPKLGKNTPANFPYIDIWDQTTGRATSIKTTRIDRDLKRVENDLRRWVRQIATFPPKVQKKGEIEHAGRLINLRDIRQRGLKVGIEPGVATKEHHQLFERVRSYARSQGVTIVEFVEVK